MSSDQEAYEAGWYAGLEQARGEAKAAIGPRFFFDNPSLAVALSRREKMLFWIRFGVELVFALPVIFAVWSLLSYAAELQTRCSDCLCAPTHLSRTP